MFWHSVYFFGKYQKVLKMFTLQNYNQTSTFPRVLNNFDLDDDYKNGVWW